MISTEHSSRRRRRRRKKRNLPTSRATMTEHSVKRIKRRRNPRTVRPITPHLHLPTTQVIRKLKCKSDQHFPLVFRSNTWRSHSFPNQSHATLRDRGGGTQPQVDIETSRDTELLLIIIILLQLAQTSALWTFWLQAELSFLTLCDIGFVNWRRSDLYWTINKNLQKYL